MMGTVRCIFPISHRGTSYGGNFMIRSPSFIGKLNKLVRRDFAQALSAGITLGNHFQFGIGMPQRFPIAAGTSLGTLRHCSDAACRALTRQHGNGALVATDFRGFHADHGVNRSHGYGPRDTRCHGNISLPGQRDVCVGLCCHPHGILLQPVTRPMCYSRVRT